MIEIDGCDRFRIVDVTVIDAADEGDAIDIDNVQGGLVLNCEINNAGGWGIHCSIESENVRVVENVVENCGYGNRDRGGIDQHNSAEGCVFVNNVCRNNRKNFEIDGKGAVFGPSNESIDGEVSDTFSGIINQNI